MELIHIVRFGDIGDEQIELVECPAVEAVLRHFLRIGSRVEVVQVREQEAQCVADLAVFVAEFQNGLRAGGDIILVVDAATPQP